MYDVVIIGAGPIGLACGVSAKRRDLDALLIDKGGLVNSLVGYPTNMEFFSTPELLEIGGHPLSSFRYKPIREEAIDYYRGVAVAEKLQIRLYEAVTGLEGEDGSYTVRTEKGAYTARKVVLATGFFDRPRLLDVPGEDLPKVTHYYKEPFPYMLRKVAIIGAKNSAAKAALECYRSSADVTLIIREAGISDSVKYWIKPDLENRIREGSIRAFFNSRVTRITPESLHFDSPDGPQVIENDHVLALTGYEPDYTLLDLFGITCQDDAMLTPVLDEETFETSRPGIYLAGTVCGGRNTSRWFIENGRDHAERIMEDIKRG